jgi:chromosome segregation ATPase
VTVLAGTVFFGRDVVSYVRTSAGYVTDGVTDCVPMEFQIERARGMIDDLVPEIRRNMHVIAKEEVEVEKLEKQIADAEANLGTDEVELKRLTSDLATGENLFHYAGRSYTADRVKVDLANRFQRFKVSEATLGSLKDISNARQMSLEAARQKLEGMLVAKRQLRVDVENLEARLQMVAAAQTTAEYNFDDSKLGRAKELIEDLRTKLDVAERMVNAEGNFQDEIPLDETAPEDIVSQVTQYFGQAEPGAEALAKD